MAIDLNGSTGISLDDNEKINIGNDSDLQIYHDGSNSYIDDTASGSLVIRGSTVYLQKYTGEYMLDAIADGAVTLYHNNAAKLATTSTGIDVTGTVNAVQLDITESTNARLTSSDAIGEVGSGTFALQTTNAAGSALKPLGFRAEDIRFATGSSERMRIDSSGYVLVGTSSARTVQGFIHKVQVEGTTAGTSSISIVRNTNSVDPPYVSFGKTRSGSVGASGVVQQNDILGRIDFTGANGSNLNSLGARIDARVDGTPGGSDMPTRLTFQTSADGSASPTERMRIASDGTLLLGTTYAGFNSKQTISFSGTGGQTIGLSLWTQSGSGSMFAHFVNNQGSRIGSITQNGTSAVAYNTSSDYRLKENVVDLTGASARINQLNPLRFNFIADDTNTLVDGFLAHEVATVVPEAITGTKDAMMDEEYEVTPAVEATYDDDGNELTAAVEAVMGTRSVPDYQGIDQSKLVPLLTAALQEALTEIASLKTRVEALEA